MKNPTRLLSMLIKTALVLTLWGSIATAQSPTPSPEPKSTPSSNQNADDGDYTITSSIEVGYRGLQVVGDVNKYQSDLGYRAGPRLFDTSFLMRAKESEGKMFDTLLVTASGWGSDPHGYLRVNAEKSEWYRINASYRRFKAFRFLNNIANPNYSTRPTDPAGGQHNFDLRNHLGDFDLTLLPKNEKLKIYLGYSPARTTGPAYTTWHFGGDDFMLLSQSKWRSNDFRVGADWKLGPVSFSFLQGFRRFNDDTSIDNQGVNLGVNPALTNFYLRSFNRTAPTSGKVDFSRFSAHTLIAKRLDITGRIIYSNATTEFSNIETITGNNFNSRITGIPAAYNPTAANQTILTLGRWTFSGDSKRPNTLGDLGVTLLATDNLRLSNTFRVETFQINGNAFYNGEFRITQANGTVLAPLIRTGRANELTKYRKIQNTAEVDYQFEPRYSVHFGYRYGTRRIERFFNGNNLANNGAPLLPPSAHEEENHTHSFIAGAKATPAKNWTMFLDVEHGTADNVFTRTSGNYDYTNVRARSRYAVNRALRFNLSFIARNNANPSQIDVNGVSASLANFGVNVKSRIFASTFDWTPNSRFSVDGGYTYTWQNNHAVIEYAFGPGVPNAGIRGQSLYFVRNNFFYLESVVQIVPRATLYAAYRINKDTGQGDRISIPGAGTGVLVQSYPNSFQSPEARLAIRINRRLDWNLGYQYYNYNETGLRRVESPFVAIRPQNYHAHLPYTSLRVYFGRKE